MLPRLGEIGPDDDGSNGHEPSIDQKARLVLQRFEELEVKIALVDRSLAREPPNPLPIQQSW